MKLIYHPLPQPREGLNGFLLRLAQGNKLTGVGELFGGRSPSLDLVLRHLGLQSGDDRVVRLFTQRGPTGKGALPLWNNRTSRYCPACLAEEGRWRQEWELSLAVACPIHSCSLVDHCKACGKALDWHRTSLLHCGCGYRFERQPAAAAGLPELTLAQLFVDKLNLTEQSGLKHLHVLTLEQLHCFAVLLGAYANARPDRRPLRIDNFASLEAARPLLVSAAQILMDWPSAFYRLLDVLCQGHGGGNKWQRLGRRFLSFRQYCISNFADARYGFVLHAVQQYLEKHPKWLLGTRKNRLSPEPGQRRFWIPVKIAARDLNTSGRRIEQLIADGTVTGRPLRTPSGRTVMCVNTYELATIRGVLADLVDQKTACSMLGIGPHRLKQLIDDDMLTSALSPRLYGVYRDAVSRSFLSNLLTLGEGLPTVKKSAESETVSLNYALQFWLHGEDLFPGLILEVIKGEIVPIAVAPGYKGLSAWCFRRRQLREWVSEQIKQRRPAAMTIPEAAKSLGMHQSTLYHLVGIGLVAITQEEGAQHLVVHCSELERFRRTYVLAAELREQFGLSAHRLKVLLATEGIFPVSGRQVNGGRQDIYLRSESLTKALQEAVQEIRVPSSVGGLGRVSIQSR